VSARRIASAARAALATAALRTGLVACGVVATACHVRGTGGQQPVDVVVPGPDDGGEDGGPPSEAGADGGEGGAAVQVDRDGHPLVAVLLVPSSLQDDFNGQPSFEANVPRTLQDALESRLEQLDTLTLGDGGPDPVDWPVPEGGTHPLLPAFAGDVLLVDPSRPCTSTDGGWTASYFDVDREVYLGAGPHTTCGGRNPAENVVDETWTLLVTGARDGGAITQGVQGPTKPPTTTFPYLAAPN
jgi:hypothetical protein